MKQVYILLSRTGTIPSRLIYRLTRGAFTHASLAMLPSTDRFFSYARRKLNRPFYAGFKEENLHTHIFGKYPDSPCALFSLSVSDEGYDRMKKELGRYIENYDTATYNFLGMLPLRMGIPIRRGMKLTCSQFVALMLSVSGDVSLPKNPYAMLPGDFLKLSGLTKLYEGTIADCAFPSLASDPMENTNNFAKK